MGLVKVFEPWPDLAYSYKISQHAVNGVWYCNPCCIWDSLCFLYDKLSMLIHCNSFHVRQQKTKKKKCERQRKLGPQVCHLTSVQFQCFGTCGFIILYVSSTTLIRHWGKHTCYMSQDSIKIIIFFGGFQLTLAEARKGKMPSTPVKGTGVHLHLLSRRRVHPLRPVPKLSAMAKHSTTCCIL